MEARVFQFPAQRVLPGDPVSHRYHGLTVAEVVAKLQDRDHQQQCRGQARLAKVRIHPGQLTGDEVSVGEQRAQRVAHPHLIGPARVHRARQHGRGRGNRRNIDRTQHAKTPDSHDRVVGSSSQRERAIEEHRGHDGRAGQRRVRVRLVEG